MQQASVTCLRIPVNSQEKSVLAEPNRLGESLRTTTRLSEARQPMPFRVAIERRLTRMFSGQHEGAFRSVDAYAITENKSQALWLDVDNHRYLSLTRDNRKVRKHPALSRDNPGNPIEMLEQTWCQNRTIENLLRRRILPEPCFGNENTSSNSRRDPKRTRRFDELDC